MGQPHRPTSFTILVIDDEPEVLELVHDLLALAGHQVIAVSNGRDGLTVARTTRLDLILLDHKMPELSGLAVLEQLKADTTTRGIPVVALTSAPAEQANELSRAGCIAFIPKPFAPAAFQRLVTNILNATVGRRQRGDDSRADQ
jgi:two-component system cell cycle response regulator DivK